MDIIETTLPCYVGEDWAIRHLRKTLLCGFSKGILKHPHEFSKLCLATLQGWIISMTGTLQRILKACGSDICGYQYAELLKGM